VVSLTLSLVPRNCVDSHGQIVSYLLTLLKCFSSKNGYLSWISFGWFVRCGRVLMVVSLPSSSIVSPEPPPSGACLSSLNGRLDVLLRLCSTTICGQIDRLNIYSETWILHAILWCSESFDCNKDEYDTENAMQLWNPKNHCCENTARSLPQSCAVVSAAPEFDYPIRQIS